VIFQPDPIIGMIAEGLATDQVNLVFNRSPGGVDVPVALDTSVEDTLPDGKKKRSSKAALEFANCAQALVAAQQ
jgi:hypothetical protein